MCRIPVSSLDISLMFVIQQRNSKFILAPGDQKRALFPFFIQNLNLEEFLRKDEIRVVYLSIENDENFTVNDSKSQK